VFGAQTGEAGEAVHAGHVEIEQHGIGFGFTLQHCLRLVECAGHLETRTGKRLSQRRHQRIADHGMVVGDQEGERFPGHRVIFVAVR